MPLLSVDQMLAIEGHWNWLLNNMGAELIQSKPVLVPNEGAFPIRYDGTKDSAIKTLEILARQMDIDPSELHLKLYSESGNSIGAGNMGPIFLKTFDRTAGLYWGRNEEDGLFHVGLEQEHLRDPEGMVATLSHELAHVKLLGKELLEKNDEPLTDLTTIAFGLGIFSANSAFRFHQGYDSWGYKSEGYLNQMEWGHALALYARTRSESKPSWLRYLNINIQADFKRSIAYLDRVQ